MASFSLVAKTKSNNSRCLHEDDCIALKLVSRRVRRKKEKALFAETRFPNMVHDATPLFIIPCVVCVRFTLLPNMEHHVDTVLGIYPIAETVVPFRNVSPV